MLSKAATLAVFLAVSKAQKTCDLIFEAHPPFEWSKCIAGGVCESQQGVLVVESYFRWIHTLAGYSSCFFGDSWDSTLCPTDEACTDACCIEGADFSTYGLTTNDNSSLTMKFGTFHDYSANYGSRVLLLESETAYQGFVLLGNEFTFDVDVSNLECGLNGALYFTAMDLDAGVSRFPTNEAGPKYGTGYCDSQCSRDVTFVDGLANAEGWETLSFNTGFGHKGACCAEFDLWEGNKVSTAFTAHPCTKPGYHSCDRDACGGEFSPDPYAGDCDPDGCGFNSYRQGNETFYGPGPSFTLDTNQPLTVVTQFRTGKDGVLSDIKRYYVQNGKTIGNAESLIPGISGNSINEDYCDAKVKVFGDNSSFQDKGGIAAISAALAKPMVLVASLLGDPFRNLLWLDSTYPTDSTELGSARGSCPTTSGVRGDVESAQSRNSVSFSNIKFGPIGSTFNSPNTARQRKYRSE